MLVYTLDNILDRQMNKEQIEVLEELIAKINAWKDSVDVFIENIGDMY